MANWKFTDQYSKTYPALDNSILSLLVFSEHKLDGEKFTGTISVKDTGVALKTLSLIVDLPTIDVTGTVKESNDKITIELTSTDADAFKDGVVKHIPLIGNAVQSANLSVKTITSKKQTKEDSPDTDEFDLDVSIKIGNGTVKITAGIPMNGGFLSLGGDFSDFTIGLNDLNFLMGDAAAGNSWFPTSELGPYAKDQTSFGLLSLDITSYIALDPFKISITGVMAQVGINKLPLKDKALYMDPLAVWISATDIQTKTNVAWGLTGAAKLCNYDNPGPSGLSDPDFTFDFTMGFPTTSDPAFTFSGNLDNPSSKSVNVMLQDLLGADTNIGLKSELTIKTFELETSANTSTGKITDFSTSIEMSGGFGILENFDLESIAVSVSYTGD